MYIRLLLTLTVLNFSVGKSNIIGSPEQPAAKETTFYTSYGHLLQWAHRHHLSEHINAKSLISTIQSFTNIVPTGRVALYPYHFDPSCVSFVSTNSLLYSGCTLPPHCGTVITHKIAKTWYGSELLFCYSAHHCSNSSHCKRSDLHYTYYSVNINRLDTYISNAGINGSIFSSSLRYRFLRYSPGGIPSYLYIVDNSTHSFTVPRLCISESYHTSIDFQPIDGLSLNHSHSWDTSCVSALTTDAWNHVCSPLSFSKLSNVKDRVVDALVRAITVQVIYKSDPDENRLPMSFFSDFPGIQSTAPFYSIRNDISIDTSQAAFFTHMATDSALCNFNISGVYFLSRCANTYDRDYDTVCYHVTEHLSNPFTTFLTALIDSIEKILLYIFNQLSIEVKSIVKFLVELVFKLFQVIFDIILDLPYGVPIILTYLYLYLTTNSHIITTTYCALILFISLALFPLP